MNRRIVLRLFAALIVFLMAAQPALAASVEEPVAETQSELVEAFVDDCVYELPDTDGEASEIAIEAASGDIVASDAALAVETLEPIPESLESLDEENAAEASAATVGDSLPDTEADVDAEPALETQDAAETAVQAAPMNDVKAEAAPAADPGKRVFDSTVQVGGETWSDVDLVRADGFTGKLAVVSGTLTLGNVTIAGQPASAVNLLDHFDLNPGASIAVTDAAPLSLSLSALSINRGSGRALKATYNGKSVSAARVKWKSSNKKLAKVSKKGRVSAKRKGTAVITASYKGQKAVCYLDITGIVYPKSVSLKKKKLTLGLNGVVSLKAKIKPANPDDPTLTWSSTRPEIASVDGQGNVTGLVGGKATIVVKTANGKTASCKVTVKAINPKSVSFQKLYVTLHPNESYQTVLKLKPSNASYTQMAYVSSDPSVATVDGNGVITAVGVGTATIAATSAVKAKVGNTCKVCVVAEGSAQLEGLVIGINPGHQRTAIKKRYPMAPGSHSYGPGVKVGATGCSTHQTEYNVVLSVGLKLKRILEEHGATVVITRTSNDVMLTNIDRAKMLNAAGVDVALQLHCNSCSNPSKTGSSSYYRPNGEWAEENRALAIQLSKSISRATGFKNRGINPYTDYMSLNWTTTPSVLLEMGYLSNSSDDHKLAKDSFRESLALGIYQGLCAYFGR